MDDVLTLKKEGLSVIAAPQYGGAILSVLSNNTPLLRAGTADDVKTDPLKAACFPCVPYFGRLYDGLSFNDHYWRQNPTLPAADPVHALHGEGWISEWTVTSHTDNEIICQFYAEKPAPNRFPFPFRALQKITIHDGAVHIILQLTNKGEHSMPGGLGLHPYFNRTKDTVVAFDAKHFWLPPSNGTKGAMTHLPDAMASGRDATLPLDMRDNSYAGFAGVATITGGGSRVRLTSDAPVIHVFAPANEAYFCLEPVTHLPGALTDTSAGYRGAVLGPEETITVSMTLSPE